MDVVNFKLTKKIAFMNDVNFTWVDSYTTSSILLKNLKVIYFQETLAGTPLQNKMSAELKLLC